jgi:hypothetical protein
MASALLDSFREFARRYSRAERAYSNARSTEMGIDRAEGALSMKQAIETEFERCYQLRKEPDWALVDRIAGGEIG